MKQFQLLLIACLLYAFAPAQPGKMRPEIAMKLAAQQMSLLFVDKKYSEYVKYVHPTVVKMFGGQNGMIDALKKSVTQSQDEGFTITGVTIGNPSKIISTPTEFECVVPQILTIKTKNGRMESTSYLLAISPDKGKKWYFIDTSGKTLEQMKTFLPTLSNQLVIPAKTKPVVFPDK